MKTCMKNLLFLPALIAGLGFILVGQAAAQTIENSNFETPYVGPPGTTEDWTTYYSFQYNPTGAGWTFTGDAGIAANGSGFAYYNSGTPYGNQFAFLQNYQGVGGSMSQNMTNLPAGNYTFTFMASQRDIAGRDNTQNQGVMVLVDGNNVGSFTPADTSWYSFQTTPISLDAGNHVLTFSTLVAEATVRVDNVTVSNMACQITPYAQFHQGDSTSSVPTSFGLPSTNCEGMRDRAGNLISDNQGRALTVNGGCALCSLSTMLSAFPGFEETTPSSLNNYLTNTVAGYTPNPVKGYISGILVTNSRAASVNWSAVCGFTGNTFYIEPNNTPVNNSTVSNYLSEYFCGYGDGIILRMEEYIENDNGSYTDNGTHFIVVIGSTNNDWSVFDPGWQFVSDYPGRLTSLSGHLSGFKPTGKSFRYFNVVGAMAFHDVNSPINSCAIVADCPIEMRITDPQGQQLGWDSLTQTNVFEIPNGSYIIDYPFSDDGDDNAYPEGDPTGIKTIYIPTPIGGNYQLTAISIGDGPFTTSVQTAGPSVLNQYTNYSGTASVGVQFTNNATVLMRSQIINQPTGQIVVVGSNATFTVTATGTIPLSYQWQKNGTNLTDGGNISGSATTNLTISNVSLPDAGTYSVIVSNTASAASSIGAVLQVTIVQNGDFETGDFTGWTQSGDNSYTFVDDGSQSGIAPYSGNYEATLGTSNSLGYLSQTLPTTVGASYLLSFWLNSPDGQTPNAFLALWNNNTLLDETNLPAFGWTNIRSVVKATGSSAVLQFGFRDDPSYLGLDDISVVPVVELPPPSIATTSLSGMNLVLNGANGLSGGTYYVLMSTNLAQPLSQWTPIATNVLSASGNFNIIVTNAVDSKAPARFYILQLQ